VSGQNSVCEALNQNPNRRRGRMTWHPRKPIWPTFCWRGKCTRDFAGVAGDDVSDDWTDDVADDCAELLAWLLTGG